jgi:Uma2 family endonuclease
MGVRVEKLSPAAFLDWENEQQTRNEYYRGDVFAMVGARRVHGLVAGNLFAALKAHLRGGRCRAFIEAMKLQPADDAIFYPDVFVTCDEGDLKTDMIFRHPLLVVEVLSESTQAYDRGLKFAAYRQIEALREYLLVDPDSRRVEVFRRNERGNFELIDQTGQAELTLESVGLTLPLAEVFDGVEAAASRP